MTYMVTKQQTAALFLSTMVTAQEDTQNWQT